MKLLNYNKAIIDIKKLRDYCLNPRNSVGKHKARMFKTFSGITREDAGYSKEQILKALPDAEAVKSFEDEFGIRYVVEIQIQKTDKFATVVTIWILHRNLPNIPQLVTCYVKN